MRLPAHRDVWAERPRYSTCSIRGYHHETAKLNTIMHFGLKDCKDNVYVMEPSIGNLIKNTREK
jgi:hypothetical protein